MTPIKMSAWSYFLLMAGVWAVTINGCGRVAMVGLPPDYPAVEKKWYSLVTDFVEVDSLTPTFRWQPLDITRASPATSMKHATVDNVRYELRIWHTVVKNRGKIVYARERLTATEHRMEQPLNPGTRYYWSVRAHFEVDGRHRITEWTLAGYPLRNEAVPNDSCLRFQTPLEESIE